VSNGDAGNDNSLSLVVGGTQRSGLFGGAGNDSLFGGDGNEVVQVMLVWMGFFSMNLSH
jgi:Ca2+-binding RTX toxin-like protein